MFDDVLHAAWGQMIEHHSRLRQEVLAYVAEICLGTWAETSLIAQQCSWPCCYEYISPATLFSAT